ncbi:LysR family transcriptional regulator [Epibacterium sp. SM1979]|uniref:LysR family transcriptional regulator n=1 Tax=Tritonibacter litoralis TaxID=2662264 RepID=A0A843YKX2_9RHOB|nr:hydrogen peroxide-inducible genes activator [Tritonibacter litoralis]MQQ09853.1 LysR family transcriptional regulator [Tritonibacter litoralis]
MMNITLRQLRYFEALAQQGHFGRAAELAAVSQPALSVQIKELEASLGLPLFERGARMVQLTGFGEEFRLRAQEILRAVDELGDLARAAGPGLAGQLRLGVIPTMAPYLLPQVVTGLGARYPQIEFRIRETQTQHLIRALQGGQLDTAIMALPVGEAGFVEHPLFDEEFVLVRPASDAGLPVPSRDMLREMQLLLLEEGHCFRDQALSFCELRPSQPREVMDGSSLSTLVQMVNAGLGVTLLPQMAVPVETRSADVSIAQFEGDKPQRRVGMVWRATNPMGDKLRAVAADIQEILNVAPLARGL